MLLVTIRCAAIVSCEHFVPNQGTLKHAPPSIITRTNRSELDLLSEVQKSSQAQLPIAG
jgi:hypothetical protein